MDIPGVKVDDLKVDVEEDGDVLYISGRRKMKIGDAMSETRFEKRFFVGENVDLDKLSAHLEDG
jgi:HSP20 family molecular chaperone IbpA